MSKAIQVFEQISADFAERLQNGENPFATLSKHAPTNFKTGTEYKGFNRFYLQYIAGKLGFKSNKWLTPNQAKTLKGNFKGQATTPIFFWNFNYTLLVETSGGEEKQIKVAAFSEREAHKEANKRKSVAAVVRTVKKNAFMKMFRVLNLDQIEGIEDTQLESQTVHPDLFLAQAQIDYSGGLPRYDEFNKKIVSMPKENFGTDQEFYSTMLSLVARSTASDMQRELESAEESLVDVFAASFMMSACDMEMALDEELVDLWLQKLNKKPMFLFSAANKGQQVFRRLSDNIVSKASGK